MAAELEAELDCPPFPSEVGHIWTAWRRIRVRKAGGFNGPAPIEWVDIDAFCRRSGQHLTSTEIEMLETIDDAYLAACAAGQSLAEDQLALKDGLMAAERRG